MLGEREVFGDSSLVRTLVQNYDVRWEWYPDLDELFSVGVFAKRFKNPIEQIDVATSGASQLSFVNAESAMNYGLEIEGRKGLGFLGPMLEPMQVFANATVMRSNINTGNSSLSALTNDERPMVGQAPYVVNAGLSYADRSGSTSATLLYNVVGKRITSAAVTPLTVDSYELPRHLLDLSLRLGITNGLEGKFDAKNLLDSSYEERQGDVVRYSYSVGRSFSVGMTWKVR
jgi:outer membrane receptor protein involved in Fe transport